MTFESAFGFLKVSNRELTPAAIIKINKRATSNARDSMVNNKPSKQAIGIEGTDV